MVWAIAALGGVDFTVRMEGQDPLVVGPLLIVAFALPASLAGWAALAVLERLTARARPIWTAVAVVVLLLSFAPVTLADVKTAARLSLGLMHVAVAAVLIPGLRRARTPIRTAAAG